MPTVAEQAAQLRALRAMQPRCPHRGCEWRWATGGDRLCPWHDHDERLAKAAQRADKYLALRETSDGTTPTQRADTDAAQRDALVAFRPGVPFE